MRSSPLTRLALVIPALLLALAPSVASAQGATHTLAYKFKLGEYVHYELANRMKITTKFAETEETALNESHALKHFRVVSVDEQGNAVLEPAIVRVRMSASFGESEPVVYDSEGSAAPPTQFRDLAATIGKPTARVRVSPQGTLLEVTPLAPGAAARDEDKKDPRYNFLYTLPKEPVAVGATWKEQLQVPVSVSKGLNRDVTLSRSYQLAGVEGNVAKITFRTAVLTPIQEPSLQAQLIQRTPAGTIEFDMAAGQIVSQFSRIDEQVINPFGPKSMMSAFSDAVERRVAGPQERGVAILPALPTTR